MAGDEPCVDDGVDTKRLSLAYQGPEFLCSALGNDKCEMTGTLIHLPGDPGPAHLVGKSPGRRFSWSKSGTDQDETIREPFPDDRAVEDGYGLA